jgi:hypothetical protein
MQSLGTNVVKHNLDYKYLLLKIFWLGEYIWRGPIVELEKGPLFLLLLDNLLVFDAVDKNQNLVFLWISLSHENVNIFYFCLSSLPVCFFWN